MTNRQPEGERKRRRKGTGEAEATASAEPPAPRAAADVASLLLAGDAEVVFESIDEEPSRESSAPFESPASQSVPVGRTLTVGRGAEFSTLREAFEQAADGDRIVVRPGRYAENVTIDRRVTLVGDGPRASIVVGQGFGCAVWIGISGVQVRGVTIVGASLDGAGSPPTSAVVSTAADVTLADCEIRDAPLSGVLAHGPKAGLVLEDSQIRNCGEAGLFIAEGAGAIVRRCRIVGNGGPAVVVNAQARVALVDCQIRRGLSHGICVGAAGHLQASGCDVSAHAGNGIVVEAGGSLAANNCSFCRNGEHGVCVNAGAVAADVVDCTFSGNAMDSWSAPESLQRGFALGVGQPSEAAPANA
ncbi:MAG: right-handed parallel beta-helix repeat-containing protein [Planctomycetaceae bacterium]|nr:right-handed parallel beta-helix repeat-containing protein [Planctomycetaceae bacterium]